MNRSNIHTLRWLLSLQWQASRLGFCWNIISSFFDGLGPIASTYILAKLLTSVSAVALQGSNDTRAVYMWFAALLLLEVASEAFNRFDQIVRLQYTHLLNVLIEEKLLHKMYELSQEQFENQDFQTKFERGKDGARQSYWLLRDGVGIASGVIGFIVAMLAIAATDPLIAAVFLAATIPISLIQISFNKANEKIYKESEPFDRSAFRSRWMLLTPSTMPEVRLAGAFRSLFESWRRNTQKVHDITYREDKRQAWKLFLILSTQPLINIGTSVHFFRSLAAQDITLDRFIFLRGMLDRLSTDVYRVSSSVKSFHESLLNIQNLGDILRTKPAIPNGHFRVQAPLTIEFKNVSFTYPGSKKPTLKNVSFKIVPGSRLALVGENGAGKTTLIKLLLRQYLATSGTIFVNGTDIRDVEQESYYKAISNLSQNYLIVDHLTIRENLTLGLDLSPASKNIKQTLEQVGADEYVYELPHKLDTRLDSSFDDGTNLSGGQLQRLGVARALLRGGDVMILDEPTSAIDAKAEYQIFNNIYKSHAGKTTLIVSHRFSTVRKADRIIVLQKGSIIEYGSHEELLQYGGLYKEMFETQAEGYK